MSRARLGPPGATPVLSPTLGTAGDAGGETRSVVPTQSSSWVLQEGLGQGGCRAGARGPRGARHLLLRPGMAPALHGRHRGTWRCHQEGREEGCCPWQPGGDRVPEQAGREAWCPQAGRWGSCPQAGESGRVPKQAEMILSLSRYSVSPSRRKSSCPQGARRCPCPQAGRNDLIPNRQKPSCPQGARRCPCPQAGRNDLVPKKPEDARVPKQAEMILSPRNQKMPLSPSRQK